jgi:hypothetical protein
MNKDFRFPYVCWPETEEKDLAHWFLRGSGLFFFQYDWSWCRQAILHGLESSDTTYLGKSVKCEFDVGMFVWLSAGLNWNEAFENSGKGMDNLEVAFISVPIHNFDAVAVFTEKWFQIPFHFFRLSVSKMEISLRTGDQTLLQTNQLDCGLARSRSWCRRNQQVKIPWETILHRLDQGLRQEHWAAIIEIDGMTGRT